MSNIAAESTTCSNAAIMGMIDETAGFTSMQYDALTLDTNIFDENGCNLEAAMLGQLSQFKEGSVQLVLSEIVAKELSGHLERKAKELAAKLGSTIEQAIKNGLLTDEAATDSRLRPVAPLEAVKKRVSAFIEKTGLRIIPANGAEINELIKRYFAPSAPFEGSGKKKNEFPDAIALLSIEKWAKDNKKKILAVSKDGGWKVFTKGIGYNYVAYDLHVAR